MKTRVCLIPGGYEEKDYYALEIFPGSKEGYNILLKVVSEFKKRGFDVRKLFSVEESIWGWIIYVPMPDTVDEDLELPQGDLYEHK